MWKGRRRDGELVCSGGEVLWTPSEKGQRRQFRPPTPTPPPAEHRTGGAWGKACGSPERIFRGDFLATSPPEGQVGV